MELPSLIKTLLVMPSAKTSLVAIQLDFPRMPSFDRKVWKIEKQGPQREAFRRFSSVRVHPAVYTMACVYFIQRDKKESNVCIFDANSHFLMNEVLEV